MALVSVDTVAQTLNSPVLPLTLTRPPRAHLPEAEGIPGKASFLRSWEAFPHPSSNLGDGPITAFLPIEKREEGQLAGVEVPKSVTSLL